MTKEDKICAFCKYHFIEEISFDSPQSCCKKRKATTEKWLKCDDFEYSDRYIEALQQKVNQLETSIAIKDNELLQLKDELLQLKTNRDEAIKLMRKKSKLVKKKELCHFAFYDMQMEDVSEVLEILERGKE